MKNTGMKNTGMKNAVMIEINAKDIYFSLDITEAVLIDIIEHGIVAPLLGDNSQTWVFHSNAFNVIKKASRLRRDLELEWQAIALVLDLLEQRDFLKAENTVLKQRLSRFIVDE